MKKIRIKSAALLLAAVIWLSGCRGGGEFHGDIEGIEQSSVVTSSDLSEELSEPSDIESIESSSNGSGSVSDNSQSSSDPEITDADSIGGDSDIPQSSSDSGGTSGSSSIGGTSSSSSSGSSSSMSSSSGTNSSSSGSSVPTNGITFSWKIGNTWEEGGKKCGTAELTIFNNSGKSINGWTANFSVPNGFAISNGWSGSFSVNGTSVTVTNAGYNGAVPNGGSVTIGFNYSCPVSFAPPLSVTFNGNAAGSSSGQSPGSGQNGNNNQNSSSGGQNQSGDSVPPDADTDIKELLTRTPDAKQGDDWLHVSGNKILDKDGREVWLTGVNWFGYNTGTNIFDGLWNSNLRTSVKAIADHGFNLIRVPISAELLNQWSRGEYPRANYNNALNPELNTLNSLQIFEYFLKLAEENGMKVMPDIHSAETDASGHNVNLWYTDKVTVNDYYHALEWLADRYKNNDTIIAIDLKNEPHGKPNESNKAIWNNSTDINNWKHTAEVAAAKVLAKNPNLLIMVEGTEIYSKNNGSYASTNSADYYFNWWGGNLRGVKDYPVNLGKYQDKLVYSPHDYGPTVYEQPWFKSGYNYESLIRDCWLDNWLYIHKNNIAPLLIGEWGGYMREPNLTWMTCLRRLIKENRLNHTFWCFNANSGDTGGLVLDDFVTWDTEKYNFVKEVLWQENGKFVGLDHQIPLGENGISISELSK